MKKCNTSSPATFCCHCGRRLIYYHGDPKPDLLCLKCLDRYLRRGRGMKTTGEIM